MVADEFAPTSARVSSGYRTLRGAAKGKAAEPDIVDWVRILTEGAYRCTDLILGQVTLIRQLFDGRGFLTAKNTKYDVSFRSPLRLYGILKRKRIGSFSNGK
jgi:hypothetical protein